MKSALLNLELKIFMNRLKLQCSLYSFLLYHMLIFVINCDGKNDLSKFTMINFPECYQNGLLCPECNLTWQPYCTYEVRIHFCKNNNRI